LGCVIEISHYVLKARKAHVPLYSTAAFQCVFFYFTSNYVPENTLNYHLC
jgi:hypothetical protein